MELSNRQALVIGMGKSGVMAARFLSERGCRVTLCDQKPVEQLSGSLETLAGWPVQVITGGYPGILAFFDFVFLSPGIPHDIKPVIEAKNQGVPVFGELELVARFCPAPVVAITGTNGKTTTTSLIGQVLTGGRKKVVVGGNIGTTILEQMDQITSDSLVVAEVSSFQLETTTSFRPKVAAILNITPDHLDRHLTMENYIAAKSKIMENQQPDDYIVLNYDQEEVRLLANQAKGNVIFFSRQHTLEEGIFVSAAQIVARLKGIEFIITDVNEIRIKGSHNLENCLAAVAVGLLLEVSTEKIKTTLVTFPGVPHRLEPVCVINGVEYINDSKGTNPDATEKALAVFKQPIVLIAGGKDKGSTFQEMLAKHKEKIKLVVILGETSPKLLAAAKDVGITNVQPVGTFPEAVAVAGKLAKPGDVVLLSPACASWDMFNNYEERGDLFKKLVLELRG